MHHQNKLIITARLKINKLNDYNYCSSSRFDSDDIRYNIFRSRGAMPLFRNCLHLHVVVYSISRISWNIYIYIIIQAQRVSHRHSCGVSLHRREADWCTSASWHNILRDTIRIRFRVIFSRVFTTQRVGGERTAPSTVPTSIIKKKYCFVPERTVVVVAHTRTHTSTYIKGTRKSINFVRNIWMWINIKRIIIILLRSIVIRTGEGDGASGIIYVVVETVFGTRNCSPSEQYDPISYRQNRYRWRDCNGGYNVRTYIYTYRLCPYYYYTYILVCIIYILFCIGVYGERRRRNNII
jgi:hypothetical protein